MGLLSFNEDAAALRVKKMSVTPPEQRMRLLVILLVYLISASVFGYAYRFAINPDGIAQLRLAGYIAEGDFMRSVTASWSPLFIWLLSPFLLLGFEGLTSARLAIACAGAGLLFSSWLLTVRFGLSRTVQFIALLIAALLISDWSIRNIGADLLAAALIILYLYIVTSPDMLNDRSTPFLSGVTGGFAYLAHHYALPFFVVHFPLILLLSGYINRDKKGFPWQNIFISWGIGISGLLIIASLWIGIVSTKYGHLVISSKGGIAHARMGPQDLDRRHPFFAGGLFKPRDDYAIHVFEDPSEVTFKTWSPFESREYFMHQIKVIKNNFIYIFNHFVRKSSFFTYPFVIGIFTLVPVVFLLCHLNKEKKFLYIWVILTLSIYCSGYLLVIARSPRRFYALMMVFLFLSVHFLEELKKVIGDVISDRRKKFLTYYLLAIAVLAFALKPGIHFLQSTRNILAIEQVNPYKEIVKQIAINEFPSPYAIIRSSQKPHTDTYIAYYIKKQLLGRPVSQDIEGITKELKSTGAKSLVVFDNLGVVRKLQDDDRYIHISSQKLAKDSRYWHAANIQQDEIIGWENEVNIFTLK